MTKIYRFPFACSSKKVSTDEVDRLFKEEKVIDWKVNDEYIFITVRDGEDVKLE